MKKELNLMERLLSQSLNAGNHIYEESKDKLEVLGDHLKEQTQEIAQSVHDKPLPSALIAIGIGAIISGIILLNIKKD
ncbi:MAG: hypothetical protein H0U73_06270 [Tatlockia sp.]|nr:hypothetical protein [Tatlockia sp.]